MIFSRFNERSRAELELLNDYFRYKRFSNKEHIGGFELEAWLVDNNALPLAINEQYLSNLNNSWVVPELSKFNIELNVPPLPLTGNVLKNFHDNLSKLWQKCLDAATPFGAKLMTIGVLPSIQEKQLDLTNMSQSTRYKALNEQVLFLRQGRPLELDIHGKEHLNTRHYDLMLEAATTSFQIHTQTSLEQAVRMYNAALIISAPMVAVAANSPFVFGRDLWDESRIPLFEQSVDIGDDSHKRVTFGNNYLKDTLLTCFEENIDYYSTLLPIVMDVPVSSFKHISLHNGTIWRWNRPLIGFDDDGTPHLRIEHRVVSSGPTIIDSIANAAFFWGMLHAILNLSDAPEYYLPFDITRKNFYTAAKNSLNATLDWYKNTTLSVGDLIMERLLPLAKEGLQELNIDKNDIDTYLSIIGGRIETMQNGALWQRRWVTQHGNDMEQLSLAYLQRQSSQLPVHEWDV